MLYGDRYYGKNKAKFSRWGSGYAKFNKVVSVAFPERLRFTTLFEWEDVIWIKIIVLIVI